MAKLNFIESQHPQALSYVACRSEPVFYLVEDAQGPELKPESEPESGPEPVHDLDNLAVKVVFGICAVFAGCAASALLAGM